MRKEIASTYWHIGNSGVSFGVIDEGYGPCFTVQSSSFGNMATVQKFYTDKKSLAALRAVLDKALAHEEYSGEYCEKASVIDEVLVGNLVEAKRAQFAGKLVSWSADGTVVYQMPSGRYKYTGVDMAKFHYIRDSKRTKYRPGDLFQAVKGTAANEEKL